MEQGCFMVTLIFTGFGEQHKNFRIFILNSVEWPKTDLLLWCLQFLTLCTSIVVWNYTHTQIGDLISIFHLCVFSVCFSSNSLKWGFVGRKINFSSKQYHVPGATRVDVMSLKCVLLQTPEQHIVKRLFLFTAKNRSVSLSWGSHCKPLWSIHCHWDRSGAGCMSSCVFSQRVCGACVCVIISVRKIFYQFGSPSRRPGSVSPSFRQGLVTFT